MPVVDLHCDTVMMLMRDQGKRIRENDLHVDLLKMKKGDYLLQCFAMFVPLTVENPFETCIRMIDRYYGEIEANADLIGPVRSYGDIEENIKKGRMSALLTIEEGGTAKGSLEFLRTFHRLGVRMITLTWNYSNGVGHPNVIVNEDGSYDFVTCNRKDGLTDFGIEMVRMMNHLGMIVDVSHLSDKGFHDVYEHCDAPFVASHSNARSVHHHCRNLDDDMIRMVAKKKGVIGINYCAGFLNGFMDKDEEISTIKDIIRHIRHMARVGGIDCVALGSDFDGIGGRLELKDASYLPMLKEELRKEGFSNQDIEQIFCLNALRVFRDVLKQ